MRACPHAAGVTWRTNRPESRDPTLEGAAGELAEALENSHSRAQQVGARPTSSSLRAGQKRLIQGLDAPGLPPGAELSLGQPARALGDGPPPRGIQE